MKKTAVKLLCVLGMIGLLSALPDCARPEESAPVSENAVPSDGIYTPDDFMFSGGSGRVSITCPRIEIRDGQVFADLVFSSEKYGYVKADGKTFDPVVGDGTTTFTIPVMLNRSMTIIGMTTAMSQPHEIEYEIFIGLAAAGEYTIEDAGAAAAAEDADPDEAQQEAFDADAAFRYSSAPQIEGLTYRETMPLQYAQGFAVYRYEGGYSLIDIPQSGTFLVVPEGGSIPSGLDEEIVVLQQPLDSIYLAATSAMSLFDAADAVDAVRMSSLRAADWTIDAAVSAMQAGDLLFAGKYSEPDYEMLLAEDCCLAIESTMIYHTPKVKEMIEDLGIPVLVDRSSYESHPLGRTEWVKLYAALTGKEETAEAFFDAQAQVIEELKDFENTGKTVAFFSINVDGFAVIRKPSDYIPQMIEIAGGKYAFQDIKTDDTGTSFSISMEEFYATAVDADYLIYNGTISDPLDSLQGLTAKSELFKDFRAVKEGHVWTTDKSFYQAANIVGQMITDIHLMLTDGSESGMTFLKQVN